MSELKCCPFCGGEATMWSCDRLIEISCKPCKYSRSFQGLVGNKKTDVPVIYEGGIVSQHEFYNKDAYEEAIEAWNTRKPMANIVEKLEEEYVDCQKNMNLVKDEDGNEAGHIYDEYLNKSIAYETAINIVKQEINNGLE